MIIQVEPPVVKVTAVKEQRKVYGILPTPSQTCTDHMDWSLVQLATHSQDTTDTSNSAHISTHSMLVGQHIRSSSQEPMFYGNDELEYLKNLTLLVKF